MPQPAPRADWPEPDQQPERNGVDHQSGRTHCGEPGGPALPFGAHCPQAQPGQVVGKAKTLTDAGLALAGIPGCEREADFRDPQAAPGDAPKRPPPPPFDASLKPLGTRDVAMGAAITITELPVTRA